MLDKAIRIAAIAHEGQKDKGGQPYILHPLRLMFSTSDETQMICAILHDVIEDTAITFDYLKQEGFSEEVLDALDALTRRENETYEDFIERIVKNKTASAVKLADLSDNLNLSRIPNPTEDDKKRKEKYEKAYERIIECLEAELPINDSKTKEIVIDGVASVDKYVSVDEFTDRFIEFIEANGWYFGGGIKEYDGDFNEHSL